jgi:hypothetical protein
VTWQLRGNSIRRNQPRPKLAKRAYCGDSVDRPNSTETTEATFNPKVAGSIPARPIVVLNIDARLAAATAGLAANARLRARAHYARS